MLGEKEGQHLFSTPAVRRWRFPQKQLSTTYTFGELSALSKGGRRKTLRAEARQCQHYAGSVPTVGSHIMPIVSATGPATNVSKILLFAGLTPGQHGFCLPARVEYSCFFHLCMILLRHMPPLTGLRIVEASGTINMTSLTGLFGHALRHVRGSTAEL